MPRQVAIVPHTHWDREWYAPFQEYRLRLVALLDGFLPLLERDPSYAHFLLDGQTAVVDDYLEVRPEAEAAIRRLVASGRLSLGPWMVLMDEFMVSGETIVRDLQMGLARAAELGGAMPVGYLPDMFGHVAQMPQILRLAGLEHAVVWRGVPQAIRSTGFWWEAPDGSRVRAEYLYGSYSNGRDMPREPEMLVERARSYEQELGAARLDGLLMMNGTDHQVPQPWLGTVVEAANAAQSDYEFRVTSLPEYLSTQPVDGLPVWRGELRSGARANVLPGVASNRVDVHQAAAAAERAVEKLAEPLAALVLAPEHYPRRLLEIAWRNLVLNSAHDSSCACSHDEVVDHVLVRYREARQIGEGIARQAVAALACGVQAAPGSVVVVNPAAHTRRGLVEVTVPGTGPLHFLDPDGRALPAQVVEDRSGERFAVVVTAHKLGWVLDLMRGAEFAGAPVAGFTVERREGQAASSEAPAYDVVVRGAGPGDVTADLEPLRDQLRRLANVPEGDPEPVFHVRVIRGPARRALLATDAVPGFGWRTYTPGDGPVPARPVTASEQHMRNEHLQVDVDPATGTFSMATHDGLRAEGLNRYVDGGDGGDTYNYSPPAEDLVIDTPVSVSVEVVEPGPLRARVGVTARYRWPTHAEGDERSCSRRAGTLADVEIRTTLELRTGERFVRVHVELDNPCRDHRLRAHFPLPRRVGGSSAECAFAVVSRGLTAEGGPNETGLPTFVSRRFVDCSDGTAGLALVHDGLLEYEVLDSEPQELALTLLRATGYLSRLEPSLRPNPAGPPVPVTGAQVLGRRAFDYAAVLHSGDWRQARLHELASELLVPLAHAPSGTPGEGVDRPPTGRMLEITGAEVSALYRGPGGLIVRVFNPAPEPCEAQVSLAGGAPARGWVVDLRGRPVRPFEARVRLGGAQIATLQLAPS